MRPPVPDEVAEDGWDRWLWAALAKALETYCKLSKRPPERFSGLAARFLERLAQEESEAKAATSE